MEIKVLGPGCAKCKTMYKLVTETLGEMGMDADVKKVEKLDEIIDAGIMLTPGLIINGKVKVTGKVPGKNDIKKYIEQEM
ncbi:MAG: thioredoxin family protein [Desulfotomaculaceae bacterium]|nr:thioredoxin family protein [Desulfotomaculaceae bacterium]